MLPARIKVKYIFTIPQCDLLVLSCDLVTSVPLHLLADFHRAHNSTLTALLVRGEEGEEGRKKGLLSTGEKLSPLELLLVHAT